MRLGVAPEGGGWRAFKHTAATMGSCARATSIAGCKIHATDGMRPLPSG
eukprot:CAMPEP_0183374764 /NCGR_PEP_ID=MMETSP0164_2-20130417/115347_1 /TAXON_ID=221442 /ORGANISM="Coccolithus pelagicus ssp braarudi, Strain PLY182g" /LENGTH=48 /DNA_ID= /DNA_START= /DNA_END= /DNA_ORIENTATION=